MLPVIKLPDIWPMLMKSMCTEFSFFSHGQLPGDGTCPLPPITSAVCLSQLFSPIHSSSQSFYFAWSTTNSRVLQMIVERGFKPGPRNQDAYGLVRQDQWSGLKCCVSFLVTNTKSLFSFLCSIEGQNAHCSCGQYNFYEKNVLIVWAVNSWLPIHRDRNARAQKSFSLSCWHGCVKKSSPLKCHRRPALLITVNKRVYLSPVQQLAKREETQSRGCQWTPNTEAGFPCRIFLWMM